MNEKMALLEERTVRAVVDGKYSVRGVKLGGDTKTVVELVQKTGPVQVLAEQYDCSGLNIVTVESGGGGDCFFHSVAYLLGRTKLFDGDYRAVRALAASAITPANVNLVLMDMAGVYVEHPDDEMKPNEGRLAVPPGVFDPVLLWNLTRTSAASRLANLRGIIETPGHTYWGDMTTAALLETVLPVNIVCLSVRVKSGMARPAIGAGKVYIGHIHDIFKNPATLPLASKNPRGLPTILLHNQGNSHWRPACLICKLSKGGKTVGYRQCFSVPADHFDILEEIF